MKHFHPRLMYIRLKEKLRYWTSFNLFKSVYYNFKFLPFEQARKLPILLSDVTFHNADSEVIIESDNIHFGMIKIGLKYNCLYWIDKTSHLDLRRGGRMLFKGPCSIGKGTHVEIEPNGYLCFGKDSGINAGANIYSFYKVVIGDDCRIGFEVTIFDSDFHPMLDVISNTLTKTYSPVLLGNNCWIGSKVLIQKGTTLADNSVVSSGSVVCGKFKKKGCIIKGNPAQVIDEGYMIQKETFYNYDYIYAHKVAY